LTTGGRCAASTCTSDRRKAIQPAPPCKSRTSPDTGYFAALERRKTVPAEIALTDPRTVGLTDANLVPAGCLA